MKLALILLIVALCVVGIVVVQQRVAAKRATVDRAGDGQILVGVVRRTSPEPSNFAAPEWQSETPQQARERYRSFTLQVHPDLREAFGLDDVKERALLELLTDHHINRVHVGDAESPEVAAQRESEEDAQFNALLGPSGAQQYQVYTETMQARRTVNRMNELLASIDRVREPAKGKLIQLVHKAPPHEMEGWTPASYQVLPPESADSPRIRLLLDHVAREDYFRLQERAFRRMERDAEGLLTPAQLQRFKQMHAEEAKSWLQGFESVRKEVGLDPVMPAEPEATLGGIIRRRIAVAGDVAFDGIITINGQPKPFKHLGPNREAKGFQASHGIWVEARPVVYDDRSFDVLIAYFEQLPRKRRQLDQWVLIHAPNPGHDAVLETLTGKTGTYGIRATGLNAKAVR